MFPLSTAPVQTKTLFDPPTPAFNNSAMVLVRLLHGSSARKARLTRNARIDRVADASAIRTLAPGNRLVGNKSRLVAQCLPMLSFHLAVSRPCRTSAPSLPLPIRIVSDKGRYRQHLVQSRVHKLPTTLRPGLGKTISWYTVHA